MADRHGVGFEKAVPFVGGHYAFERVSGAEFSADSFHHAGRYSSGDVRPFLQGSFAGGVGVVVQVCCCGIHDCGGWLNLFIFALIAARFGEPHPGAVRAVSGIFFCLSSASEFSEFENYLNFKILLFLEFCEF